MRKQTNVCFSQRAISSMFPVLNKYTNRLLTDIEQHVGGPTFDINTHTLRMGGSQVMENLMGLSGEQYVVDAEVFDKMEDVIMGRMFNPLYQIWLTYRFSSMYKIKSLADRTIHKFFGNIVNVKEKGLKETKMDEGQKFFIEEMMRFEHNGKKMNFKDLTECVGVMYLAAFETSALTISYACLMMALHPDVDQKLANEIRENYSDGDDIDNETLKKFPYLDLVVKETLRHFPSVPLTSRQCMEDYHVGKLFVCLILIFEIDR